MREIAIKAGRGEISSSTVHNIFSSPKVPRWAFLEQVVKALDGAQDQQDFHALWEAAWRVENHLAPRRKGATDLALPAGQADDHRASFFSTGRRGTSAAAITRSTCAVISGRSLALARRWPGSRCWPL